MQKKNLPYAEYAILTVGEIIVSLIVVGVYLAIGKFSYQVITGVLLGSLVTIFNFVFLSIAVNRAVDNVMALRGDKELDEEEAEKFAAEHSAKIQQAVKASYFVRMLVMLGALVAAFLLDWFDVIATLVPLLMFRPIITLGEFFRKKKEGGK